MLFPKDSSEWIESILSNTLDYIIAYLSATLLMHVFLFFEFLHAVNGTGIGIFTPANFIYTVSKQSLLY